MPNTDKPAQSRFARNLRYEALTRIAEQQRMAACTRRYTCTRATCTCVTVVPTNGGGV